MTPLTDPSTPTDPTSIEMTGRRVRMDGYGDTSVLYVEQAVFPPPGPGEVVVRVHASGINPGEAKIRDGSLHQMFPSTFPQGQGSDLAGTVAAVGAGVDTFAVGDEVLGWTDGRAAQADYVTTRAEHLAAKPAEVDWTTAGGLFVAGTTAWAAVEAVGLGEGDTVAISGASGGVGHLAVQLAKRSGARVIAIAGSDSADWLKAYGAEPVVYGDGLAERLAALVPDGLDALIDTSGAGYVTMAVELGVAPHRVNTIADFEAAAEYDVQTQGSAAASTAEVVSTLAGMLADGSLELRIEAVYPLEQVREAYAELAGGHAHGKVVLDLTAGS